MNSMLVRVTFPAIAILAWHPRVGFTQARPASWLRRTKTCILEYARPAHPHRTSDSGSR